ncbi:MerR family transcriptional regulator [Bordetella sp. FB-8]|uniref:MerR family transcriptional regulator n=1 Tax=Bordetella sp. FB-8 TaxID=1159870 RepID=UPI000362E479|nr:MerR family transcriptional regulator [Bordetella sp. FB-8]
MTSRNSPSPNTPVPADATSPAFRSGAVARMARMPVATLRVWEQRYRAVHPATAPSGHRLYSPADLQRVMLLRQLTEQGHAIGSIAGLDFAQLQEIARIPATQTDGGPHTPVRTARAPTWVVVGTALATRLQRAAVLRHLAYPVPRLAVFDSLAEATAAASVNAAELLLWQAPVLRPGKLAELQQAGQAWRTRHAAVLYRFAQASTIKTLADTGSSMLREPADDDMLGAWLGSIDRGLQSAPPDADPRLPADPASAAAPRRFDDAMLTAIAGLSSTLACECPRHIAELLMQLTSFEAYSASCIHRDAPDANLHAYLQQVAGTARSLFESALDRVAQHDGLTLR